MKEQKKPRRPDGRDVAATAIRRTREHLGLSQEVLAERAGVSVRTLRSLERSTTQRPRRETLARVAAALDLDPVSSGRVLAAWGRPPHTGGGEISFGAAPFLDEIRAFAASATLLHVDQTTWVNGARVIVRSTSRMTVKARSAPLTHVYLIDMPDPVRRDMDLVDLEGCTVAADVTASDGVRVVQLLLDRPLAVHEITTVRFSQVRRASFDAPPPLDYTGSGFQTPTDLYTLRVCFDDRAVPERVLRCVQDRPFGERRAIRSIDLSPAATAFLAIEKPRPAAHLLRWEW